MDTNIPEWVRLFRDMDFQSGTRNTPESKAWMNSARKWFSEFLKDIEGSNLDFNTNHFEFSGFFTDSMDQVWYFSSGDVRFKTMKSMLIRSAKSYTDYMGYNRFISYNDEFFNNFKDMIENSSMKFIR